MEPRFTQNGVTDGGDVSLAQTFSHILCMKGQIVPEPNSESKERVSESTKGMASDRCWAKELVKILLSHFVWVFSFLAKIVRQC